MRKYLNGVHSCVSNSNGMRHSNDYGDMDTHESVEPLIDFSYWKMRSETDQELDWRESGIFYSKTSS